MIQVSLRIPAELEADLAFLLDELQSKHGTDIAMKVRHTADGAEPSVHVARATPQRQAVPPVSAASTVVYRITGQGRITRGVGRGEQFRSIIAASGPYSANQLESLLQLRTKIVQSTCNMLKRRGIIEAVSIR